MQENDIDEIFARELNGKHTIPPARVWDGIAADLARQRKRRIQARLGRIAAAACTVFALGLGLHHLTAPNRSAIEEDEKTIAEQTPASRPLTLDPMQTAVPTGHAVPEVAARTIKTDDLAAVASPAKNLEEQQIKNSAIDPDQTMGRTSVSIFPEAEPTLVFQADFSAPDAAEIPIQMASLQAGAIDFRDDIGSETESQPKNDEGNLIVHVLNAISRNLIPEGKELQFSNDDEGTIRIDISKNLVRQKL